jgi:hypothetical protein
MSAQSAAVYGFKNRNLPLPLRGNSGPIITTTKMPQKNDYFSGVNFIR